MTIKSNIESIGTCFVPFQVFFNQYAGHGSVEKKSFAYTLSMWEPTLTRCRGTYAKPRLCSGHWNLIKKDSAVLHVMQTLLQQLISIHPR